MHARAFQHIALIGKYLPKNMGDGTFANAPAASLLAQVLGHVAQCIVAAGSAVSIEAEIARHTGGNH